MMNECIEVIPAGRRAGKRRAELELVKQLMTTQDFDKIIVDLMCHGAAYYKVDEHGASRIDPEDMINDRQ